VPNRLLRLAARDAEGPIPFAVSAATEPFADVRADGLRGISELSDVNQRARSAVDELIDLTHHEVRSVENGKISVIVHLPD